MLFLIGCSEPLPSEQQTPLDGSYSTTGSPSVYASLKEYDPPDFVLSPSNSDDAPSREQLTLHGRVVSSEDLPVANAVVACWCMQWDGSPAFIGKVMTDAHGRYSIDANRIREILYLYDHVADHVRRSRKAEIVREGGFSAGASLGSQTPEVQLFAADEKNAIGWTNAAIVLSASEAELDIRLLDQSGVIAGDVVDENRKPVVGQKVWLGSLKQFSINFDWVAQTDEKGRFVFSDLPGGLDSCVIIRDQGEGKVIPAAYPFTSPDNRIKEGRFGSNPCNLTKRKTFETWNCRGQLLDRKGQPIVGAVVRGTETKTTTNEVGEYDLALPAQAARLHFEFPLHERIPAFQRPIDFSLVLKGKPEDPITIQESEWVTGRILSTLDNLPVPGIKIINESGEPAAITDERGKFRGLCSPQYVTVWTVPEFLSRSEQHFYQRNVAQAHPSAMVIEDNERKLGDIRIPVNRPDMQRTQLRVVLPDGKPAHEAQVAIWTLSVKYPEWSVQSQIFNQEGKRSCHALTDEDGICSFLSVGAYDAPQFAVVAYPAVDPAFFGELQLNPSKSGSESQRQELRLVSSRTLSGLVTLNGKPRQATRVIVSLQSDPETKNASIGIEGQHRFQFLEFVSATDSRGRYSIQVPDADGYSVDVLDSMIDGPLREVYQRTHDRNLPVLLPSKEYPVPEAGPIDGPAISFLSGNGVVRGQVLGSNQKPFYAPVHLDLPMGTVVLGLHCRENNVDAQGNYTVLSEGRFELTGVPEGAWHAYATVAGSERDRGGDTLPKDSDLVPVRAGDSDKTLLLKRHAR